MLDFFGRTLLPSTLIIFLLFCSGIQDVVPSFSTAFGCQSIRWRSILIFSLASSVISYSCMGTKLPTFHTWMHYLKFDELSDGDDLRVLYPSLAGACLASVLANMLNYPLALSPLILLSQMSSLWILKGSDFDFYAILRLLAVVYLGLPLFAGSVTWILNRIFLQALIFSDPENRFRRTLAWSSMFYPISVSLATAALMPRFLAFNPGLSFPMRVTYSLGISLLAGAVSYAAFKFLIRAVVKRQAFLKYPQEYALYLERADHQDRPDLEARGLGPSALTTSTIHSSANHPNSPSSSSSSSAAPTPNLLHAKRSEEIFRPLLLLLSGATSLSTAYIESVNFYVLLRHVNATRSDIRGLLIIGFLALVIGRLTLSKRVCRFAATGIIPELAPSQAFAIQFGILLTGTLAAYMRVTFLSAPVFYWISALAAVGVTKSSPSPAEVPQPSNKSLVTARTAAPGKDQEESFKKREYGRLILFWILLCIMSAAFGFLVVI